MAPDATYAVSIVCRLLALLGDGPYARIMARPDRIELAGGVFHVTARGNRRQSIFADDLDRERLLALLDDVARRCSWLVHTYCLMPNHFHLVVETLEETLSRGMQRLNGLYAQGFNRRHDLSGHLFQGRFYSDLVESEVHLVELGRYVVLNPVRARLCREPGAWQWSSYLAAVGLAPSPSFLVADRVLELFGRDRETARRHLAEFVLEGIAPPRAA